jgi:imidazole glycerol phosphate synthase glutamine amidotransferase subunit
MIAVIDYGAGNLRSVTNTLHAIGVAAFTVVWSPEGLADASKIILPGVGHFGHMMRELGARGLLERLRDRIQADVPFLGICLGLHALFESSEEAPEAGGLGLFAGTAKRFPAAARVPHMGWNELEPRGPSRLLAGLAPRSCVYFAHSYYVPLTPYTAAACTYTLPFTAAFECANVFGVQFHPEKSGALGLEIMRNFVEL